MSGRVCTSLVEACAKLIDQRVEYWSFGFLRGAFQGREVLAESVSVPLSHSLSSSERPWLGAMLEARASPYSPPHHAKPLLAGRHHL